jgi:hypothetical protein
MNILRSDEVEACHNTLTEPLKSLLLRNQFGTLLFQDDRKIWLCMLRTKRS